MYRYNHKSLVLFDTIIVLPIYPGILQVHQHNLPLQRTKYHIFLTQESFVSPEKQRMHLINLKQR